MHKLLGVCLLALAVASCGKKDSPTAPTGGQPQQGGQGQQQQQQTSIAGVWTGTAISTQIPGARFSISVALTQTGSNIVGSFSCRPLTGTNCAAPVASISGTLNGTALTAQVIQPGGAVACESFNGTVSSSSAMSGSFVCGVIDAGTWTLAK
jgi:hypothetical protein